MTQNTLKLKKTYTRTVYGRRVALLEGRAYRFELRADGLYVWRNRSRKKKRLTFADLVQVASGQGLLQLQ